MAKRKAVDKTPDVRGKGGNPPSEGSEGGGAARRATPSGGAGDAESREGGGPRPAARRRPASASKLLGSSGPGVMKSDTTKEKPSRPRAEELAAAVSGADGHGAGRGVAPGPEVPDEDGGGEQAAPAASPPFAPLVTAYDIGNFLNWLGYLLPQVYLGVSGLKPELEEVLGKLGRAVRDLAPASEKRRLRAAVTGPIDALLGGMDDGRHGEYLMECNDDLESEGEVPDLIGRREEILRPVFEAIDAARLAVEKRLEEHPAARLAFELGEVVDQGIRPPGVHRHLYEPPPPGPKYEGPLRVLSRQTIEEARLRAEPEGREVLLSNVTRRAGEIPPGADWFEEVVALSEELDLNVELTSYLVELARDAESDKRDVVGRVVEALRGGLTLRQMILNPENIDRRGRTRRNGAGTVRATEKRDRFIYESCMLNVVYKVISAEVSARGWGELSELGVLYVARRYAKEHEGYPPPPPRKL